MRPLPGERVVYTSEDDDSTRWDDFAFRDGDIVISTRSKSGTTWLQRICALLVFQTPDLPAPLSEHSPWLDWTGAALPTVLTGLAGQRHRRFIKTHTPLDGLLAHLDEAAGFALDEAASFAAMKARTGDVVPDPGRILKDREAFFRRGGSGVGRELLTGAELTRYHERCAELARPDVLAWLHRYDA